MQSIAGIVDIAIIRGARATPDAPLDLVIEIPHGATLTTDFTSLQARLTSPLPAKLVDFFHVNTDAGAPELGFATSDLLVELVPSLSIAVVRCRIPRTFIDCNRRIDAAPADFKAGKVTPGLMPWIVTPEDRALLRAAYDRYIGAVAETTARLDPARGAMLMLHTYAPRSVDVVVDEKIVESLHHAYLPEVEPTWPLRPSIDVISKTIEGVDHAPRSILDELRAQGVDFGESATYPMHPSTLAYDHVMARPGRAMCIEYRRDLLADPFVPFAQQSISPTKIGTHARPLARAISRWWA